MRSSFNNLTWRRQRHGPAVEHEGRGRDIVCSEGEEKLLNMGVKREVGVKSRTPRLDTEDVTG